MSRKLNEMEDKLVAELMELATEAASVLMEVADDKEHNLSGLARNRTNQFRRRFGMLCYNHRHRSNACKEAYKAIMEEANRLPDEELAGHLRITTEELKELRTKKDVELMNKLFEAAER